MLCVCCCRQALQALGVAQAFTKQADFSAASATPLMLTDAVQAVSA